MELLIYYVVLNMLAKNAGETQATYSAVAGCHFSSNFLK